MAVIPRIKLGSQGLEVSKLGLGCMGMSAFYGHRKPDEDMIRLIHEAVNMGVTFLDSADIYGPYTNEILVGKAIKGIREKVQVATKFSFCAEENGSMSIRGDPEHVRAACEASLKRLDVDYIDLYYQHRVDPKVPIEITVGAMKKLVEEGKVKYIGLSEAPSSDIRRAHAIHPITAVQFEWSLWSRDCEKDIVSTCRELGIGIVPYSPLGRGFFSGKAIVEELADDDSRKSTPRFRPENIEHNKVLYERLSIIAAKRSCTPGQLALAWVLNQGEDVAPIPGTTKLNNLKENVSALALHLSKEDMEEIESAVPLDRVAGERYDDARMSLTWRHASTPPLSAWQYAGVKS